MQSVLNYLKKNHNRFVTELCDYVRFPSVSAQPHHRKDMWSCAEWLSKHCRQIGLDSQICSTNGHPVVVARTPRAASSRKPHFVVYGHYDVQPAEPFELWRTSPFEPRIDGHSLFARGASDNKGQNLAHLKAVEAYLKTGTELPCDLTFVIEGEEEVGSSHLAQFLRTRREELRCEAVVVSDTGMPDVKHPALTYALRGISAFEVTLRGPSRDLHSGIFGGSIENPAMALCRLMARVHDPKGRIAIPGFYDSVKPLAAFERKELARLPFNRSSYKKFLGVPELFGEKGFTPVEQFSARPTFEINGLTSGYQGDGSKTIIPAWARVKISIRLVPNQNPARIYRSTVAFLKKHCPPTMRMEIADSHGAEAYLVSPKSRQAQAALRALKAAFGRQPVLLREGGSIPIVNEFKKILRVDTLLVGLALPDDNAHSPNEKFDLDVFAKGQRMSAFLWQELAGK